MGRRARPRQLHLVLLEVTKVRGQPAAVFGRMLLPADAALESYSVALLTPEEAAALAALLEMAKEDGDDLARAPGRPRDGRAKPDPR